MSNSKFIVTLSSGGSSSELYLQDSQRKVVAYGLGHIRTELDPGFYKITQRVGDAEKSEVVEISSEASTHQIAVTPLEFASPIPLQGTTSSREFQQSEMGPAAATYSMEPNETTRSTIFLMLRDSRWEHGAPNVDRQTFLVNELDRLCFWSRSDGSAVHPLGSLGRFDVAAGCFVAHISLPVGSYILSQEEIPTSPNKTSASNKYCLALEATMDWSPQVFLQIASGVTETSSLRLDLDHAAIVYAAPNSHLDPNDPDLLLLEVARKALGRGRSALAADVLNRIVSKKFQDPMLGLFAAHLLLDGTKPDIDRASIVIENTSQLLGEAFPDIIALRHRIAHVRGVEPDYNRIAVLNSPPLLAPSWSALIRPGINGGPSAVDLSESFGFQFTVLNTTTWFMWTEGKRPSIQHKPRAAIANLLPSMPADFWGGLTPEYLLGTYDKLLGRIAGPARGLPTIDTQSLILLVFNLVSDPRLDEWFHELKEQDLRGTLSENLTLFDRSMLSSLMSVIAFLRIQSSSAMDVIASFASNLVVPKAVALESLELIADEFSNWLSENSTEDLLPRLAPGDRQSP